LFSQGESNLILVRKPSMDIPHFSLTIMTR
jgi:hypothetical protein